MKDKEHEVIKQEIRKKLKYYVFSYRQNQAKHITGNDLTDKIIEIVDKHYVSKHEILAKLNNKKHRVDIELQFRDPADRQFYINALDMVLRILNVDKLEKELEKENIKEK